MKDLYHRHTEAYSMKDYTKYIDFTEHDLVMDPYFQEWVIHPDKRNRNFWETFFETYPHKKEAGENARSFLQDIPFRKDYPDEGLIQRSLAAHLQAIDRIENSTVIPIRKRYPFQKMAGIAATFGGAILVASALFLFVKKERSVSVNTQYGEMRSVTLPDSSLVVLNAHSTITFSGKWDKGRREVWLEGEAFFNVNRTNRDSGQAPKDQPFYVHTDHVNIEVLGTSFDIRLRRGKAWIVLQTGKIKISFKDNSRKDIVMRPGEMLDYDHEGNRMTTATINAEKFSAWKEKKLLLDNPTAKEIIQYLEDNFGEHIVLADPELGDRKIEGAILLTNMDDALFVLSTVLNADILKKEGAILLRHR